MRYAERFFLKNISLLEEYKKRHDGIWPEMLDLLKRAGIRNYSIWVSGTDIIAYYELDDLQHCLQVLKESPVKKRWDEYMSDIICFSEKNAPEPIELAFLLE